MLLQMKNGNTLGYFANYCLWKHAFDLNPPQNTPNLVSLTFSENGSPFALFKLKIREIKCRKKP